MFSHCSFGRVKFRGREYTHDLVIHTDGRVSKRRKELSRRRYGTSHILSEDELSEILEEEPDVIIVGTGVHGALRVPDMNLETRIISLPTCEAAEKYNRLIKGERVAAVIHVTC